MIMGGVFLFPEICAYLNNQNHRSLILTYLSHSPLLSLSKRYLIIDQQIARLFVNYSECLYNPPSLLCNSNTDSITSRIPANHAKGLGFQPIVKSLCSLMFLQRRISFLCPLAQLSRPFSLSQQTDKVIKNKGPSPFGGHEARVQNRDSKKNRQLLSFSLSPIFLSSVGQIDN